MSAVKLSSFASKVPAIRYDDDDEGDDGCDDYGDDGEGDCGDGYDEGDDYGDDYGDDDGDDEEVILDNVEKGNDEHDGIYSET